MERDTGGPAGVSSFQGQSQPVQRLHPPSQSPPVEGSVMEGTSTGAASSSPVGARPKQKRNRKSTACASCRRRKVSCDRQRPCSSCVSCQIPEVDCYYEHEASLQQPRRLGHRLASSSFRPHRRGQHGLPDLLPTHLPEVRDGLVIQQREMPLPPIRNGILRNLGGSDGYHFHHGGNLSSQPEPAIGNGPPSPATVTASEVTNQDHIMEPQPVRFEKELSNSKGNSQRAISVNTASIGPLSERCPTSASVETTDALPKTKHLL